MPLKVGEAEGIKPTYIYDLTLEEARSYFSQTNVYHNSFGSSAYSERDEMYQIPTLD